MSDPVTRPAHTALPLPVSYVAGDSEHQGALFCKTHCIADADISPEWAALIVRAVNLHDDLVKALEQLRREYGAFKKVSGETLVAVDAILGRAKEQP